MRLFLTRPVEQTHSDNDQPDAYQPDATVVCVNDQLRQCGEIEARAAYLLRQAIRAQDKRDELAHEHRAQAEPLQRVGLSFDARDQDGYILRAGQQEALDPQDADPEHERGTGEPLPGGR